MTQYQGVEHQTTTSPTPKPLPKTTATSRTLIEGSIEPEATVKTAKGRGKKRAKTTKSRKVMATQKTIVESLKMLAPAAQGNTRKPPAR
jgi:hypothetical protein